MKLTPIHAWLLLALLHVPLAVADENCRGIGGTGHACGIGGTGLTTDNGLGGTGHRQDGIGGTGHSADGIGGTGIVGIITGFGSVWVNGLEVHYDAQTQGATGALNTQELAIGQVVAINAEQQAGRWQARQMSVVQTVSGQISSVNETAATLTVLGQTVQLNAQILHDFAQPKAGELIKISGLRLSNGNIAASHIQRLSELNQPALVGPITAINGNTLEIYGLKIQAPQHQDLRVGEEISVSGKLANGELQASDLHRSATSELLQHATQLELQGYVAAGKDGEIQVGNLAVIPPAGSNWKNGELVHVSAHFSADHRLLADRVELSRDIAERGSPERHDHAETQMERNEHGGVERLEHFELESPEQPEHADHSQSENHAQHNEANHH